MSLQIVAKSVTSGIQCVLNTLNVAWVDLTVGPLLPIEDACSHLRFEGGPLGHRFAEPILAQRIKVAFRQCDDTRIAWLAG